MKANDLEETAKQLADARQQILALRHLLNYGVLVDAHAIAMTIALKIKGTARELEARTNQLELELEVSAENGRKT